MRYFGLFSSDEATIRGGNLLDTLCGQLEKLLSFQPGERDLVMLQHKFVVEWEDGKKVSDALRWMKALNCFRTTKQVSSHIWPLHFPIFEHHHCSRSNPSLPHGSSSMET